MIYYDTYICWYFIFVLSINMVVMEANNDIKDDTSIPYGIIPTSPPGNEVVVK